MADPIFLDTNIFMYAAGKSHPYKNPCLHILKDVETKALSAIVNTEVFQELLYRYTHIGNSMPFKIKLSKFSLFNLHFSICNYPPSPQQYWYVSATASKSGPRSIRAPLVSASFNAW